jgi:hypothetical protein
MAADRGKFRQAADCISGERNGSLRQVRFEHRYPAFINSAMRGKPSKKIHTCMAPDMLMP